MMISAKGLKKSFKKFEALKGIDINVDKGEIYGFLGQNGAGKSTTMNILAGLSKPDAGTCLVNGWDVNKVTHPGDIHIGYLPEEPRLYPWLTAKETLLYLGSRYDKGCAGKRADEMLDWIGLSKSANRRVGGFSRGMKQRLGMGAALFYDNDLILLDEPSSALDPEGRSAVLNLILDLKKRGKTVFLSTHILSDAQRVCDRIGILTNGIMRAEKPLDELLNENIKSIYDIEICSDLEASDMSKLKEVEGVLAIEAENRQISVEVRTQGDMAKELMLFFIASKICIRSFGLRKPSLEDIFLEETCKNEN